MAFAAVLDANVLYPIGLTDFFLTLAGYDLYRPHWSTEILEEVRRNLLEKHPGITSDQLEYRFHEMNRAHPGALVDPPVALTSVMTNHPKDRHVLATAVATHASVIVTSNLEDFGVKACQPHGVEAQRPDVFAEHLVDLDPGAAVRALTEMSERTLRPHRDFSAVFVRLQQELPRAMELLGSHIVPGELTLPVGNPPDAE